VNDSAGAALPQETLLAIIAVQQEIVEADLAFSRVMDVVVRRAARLTAADAAVVELHEGDDMVYSAASGTATQYLGLRLRADTSLSGLCVQRDEALRCDDSEDDPRVDRDACRRVGARSMLVTPLRFRGAAIGVLKVYSASAHAFDDRADEVLRLLVGIIAASMHRAREYEGLTLRALHDTLTGLANRHQLESVLDANIAAKRPFAVVYLDLNGFKKINDERGHAAGDRLLQCVAERLLSSIRDRDLAARIGGDEFIVILDGIATRTTAEETVHRLQQRIAEPIDENGASLSVTASAGWALFPEDGADPDTVLAAADAAMYARKQRA